MKNRTDILTKTTMAWSHLACFIFLTQSGGKGDNKLTISFTNGLKLLNIEKKKMWNDCP